MSKKNLVIICGAYYPKPSATGVCAEQYSNLLNDDYLVSIVCGASSSSVQKYCYNGKQVYPVASRYVRFQKKLEELNIRWLLQISKIPVRLLGLLRHPNVLYSYYKCAFCELENINRKKRIDVVMSIGAPMASHAAAAKFKRKHSNVKWIALCFDSYGAQNNNDAKSCSYEKKVMDQADHVFLSEEIFNNNKHLLTNNSRKYSPLPYLIMQKDISNFKTNIKLSDGKYNLVYAGSFYKDLRNPEFLLSSVCNLPSSIVLHLFCSSDCDDLINKYVSGSNGRIVRHALIQQEEVLGIYQKADILVNVGNNSSQFKPSKLFEYMSTLKPIINIYYEGFYDITLEQYPKCLQICNNSDVRESSNAIYKFVQNNAGTIIKPEQLGLLLGKHGPLNIKLLLNGALK